MCRWPRFVVFVEYQKCFGNIVIMRVNNLLTPTQTTGSNSSINKNSVKQTLNRANKIAARSSVDVKVADAEAVIKDALEKGETANIVSTYKKEFVFHLLFSTNTYI